MSAILETIMFAAFTVQLVFENDGETVQIHKNGNDLTEKELFKKYDIYNIVASNSTVLRTVNFRYVTKHTT